MKKLGSILFALVALALIIGAIVLVVKLVHGALNTILGILVIIALVVIVIWMFSYARRNRK
jgi:Flp pilus assembly protein TadB